MAKDTTSEDIQGLLKQVVEHFDREDRAVRERQIRLWKKLKYYWQGFERIWWSEVAHDWRVWDVDNLASGEFDQAAFYDKPISVFRAYLESIIAALSVSIPVVKCFPDDAENENDLETARAGDKIAKLIYRHNDVILKWIHGLYIYCTEGTVFAYNYSETDEKYGTYETPKTEQGEMEQQVALCPACGQQFPDEVLDRLKEQEIDEFDPGDDDVAIKDLYGKNEELCPNCSEMVDPDLHTTKIPITRVVGVTHNPKARQCIKVYGGLNVKIANYAIEPCETPYLIYAYETHYSNALEEYPDLKDNLKIEGNLRSGGMYDPYERWGRLNTQYFGEYPLNNVTCRYVWLRPASFNILASKEDVDKLHKKYPDGVKVVMVNDQFAEACNEDLDDHWTMTQNPLSDYVTHDPLGVLVTSVQEITTNLVSLVLQTIEHGIGQTFADPNVLDFDAYKQSEVSPGSIYPLKPSSGKGIQDAFFQVKTATLSGEVLPFAEKIQELGQIASGALPSLFGGSSNNSSRTAAQYSMSRAQALQRLQTPWKMFTIWWKQVFGKVIPAYIKDMASDERFVEEANKGEFINVVIRKAQLSGKLGNIELEASEELPLTWSQQKDVLMQLIQSGVPELMQVLQLPENAYIVKELLGIPDLVIPGEDDRNKQYDEIQQLIQSTPMQDAMGQMAPSVDIEPLVDNNQIHAEICRNWLISERGRLAKIENQAGYQNVLLHMQHHMNVGQAMAGMAAPPPQPQNNNNPQQPKPQENNNVPNAQPTPQP